MKTSKDILKKAGVIPRLRLFKKLPKGGADSTGAHRVKLIADKEVQGTDPETGKECEYVRYLVEENGEKKIYETKKIDKKGDISYLVIRLSEIEEGAEVILEGKRRGIKNYVDVSVIGAGSEVELDEDHDEGGDIQIDDADIPDDPTML